MSIVLTNWRWVWQVQLRIGAKNAVALDLTAACSGFVVGLVLGAQNIRTGLCKNILVIGADALSRYVDWRDRCMPFLPLPCVLLAPFVCSFADKKSCGAHMQRR
jgi:3-oxoacyl-[acyl-carrier-protein] synthase III